jgi:hypothetical protein
MRELRGRVLFSAEMTYEILEQRFEAGHVVTKTPITNGFSNPEFKKAGLHEFLPLFLFTSNGELLFFTSEIPPKPHAGDVILSLASPKAAASGTSGKNL